MDSRVSVAAFSADNLFEHLANGTCLSSDVSANSRAAYMASYLTEIGAATIVTEHEYVDADYLDDYASFYAKSFDPISNRCRRLHFFDQTFGEDFFRKVVVGEETDDSLRQSYLGFIVARPLPTAVIGRSALRTYPSDGGRRHYPAVREYHVNLFGLRLSVNSLAFQEQDTSLAACATVALWSCFQKTQELFKSLAPTPVAITRAANRLLLAARPFPSRGLQIQQVCNAIAVVGLDPEVYEVTSEIPFITLLYSYLRLGLPVLVIVEIPNIGLHAIAVNGYSLRGSQQISSEGLNVNKFLPPLIGSRIDELYGHDDQNGPFARLKLIEPTPLKPIVTFVGTGPWSGGEITPKAVVVPVYQKIRTGFREVLKWLPVLSAVASWVASASEFEWDVHLMTSNDFKAQLRSGPTSMSQSLREAALTASMPKYLWKCSLSHSGSIILEALLDTTAMVNGFPILKLWWPNGQHAQTIHTLLANPALSAAIRQKQGERLLKVLSSS